MICSSCEIRRSYRELKAEYEALKAELARVREEKAGLEVQNGKLKRQLALYQSVVAPVSQRKRRALKPVTSEKRFPGRPKGYRGITRPTPDPDIMKAPEWDNCENCGAPLPLLKTSIIASLRMPPTLRRGP